ncbi:hypothetical protein SBRV1_gp26 [Sulfolobales Beppu rod-shaped virus 1]|uniref:Uncharacterized protein n=1 Tax=Sulfolobales Beppu rod-shaped virus 1 TaxID=2493121 RepID=A0A3Q8Q3X2_9VIRU|nr:hypothetical protein QIT32_gp26 [Sulfolobales Beppu rod-shaped virus 1]AZI75915.1 hypothetical protein SBRV1_gp26 [Sulfolobales Beppu rod-shaped virus 1]
MLDCLILQEKKQVLHQLRVLKDYSKNLYTQYLNSTLHFMRKKIKKISLERD